MATLKFDILGTQAQIKTKAMMSYVPLISADVTDKDFAILAFLDQNVLNAGQGSVTVHKASGVMVSKASIKLKGDDQNLCFGGLALAGYEDGNGVTWPEGKFDYYAQAGAPARGGNEAWAYGVSAAEGAAGDFDSGYLKISFSGRIKNVGGAAGNPVITATYLSANPDSYLLSYLVDGIGHFEMKVPFNSTYTA